MVLMSHVLDGLEPRRGIDVRSSFAQTEEEGDQGRPETGRKSGFCGGVRSAALLKALRRMKSPK